MRRILAAITLLTLAVSGCSEASESGPSVGDPQFERDRSAHAELDRSRGSIRLPLDDYWIGTSEVRIVSEAIMVLMGDCVRDRGFSFSYDKGASGSPIVDDRTYGFWVRDFVERYGIAGPTGDGNPPQAPNDEQKQAWSECADEANSTLDYEAVYYGTDYPVLREIAGAATQAAHRDPEWAATLAEFRECVEAEGLSLMQDFPFGVELPADNEQESIRRLLIGVGCKDQLDFIQRVTDILAQYQAPLIKERATELAEPKKVRDNLLEKAQTALTGR